MSDKTDNAMRLPLSPETWLSWMAVGLLWLIRWLPRGLRNALSEALASLIMSRNTSTNRAVLVNLAACFPKLDANVRKAIAKRYVALHLQAFMLLPRNWWGSDKSIIDTGRIHNREHLDNALATQRPVVLLVTHSAGLDAGLLALSPYYPLQGIYNPIKNPVIDYLVWRGRHRFGAVPMSRGSGFRQLIKGLHDGQLMCYLSDEDYGKEGSVFAPFFSRQKATLAMLPRLVKKTNALVVPLIAHHDPDNDGVDVHLFPALKNYPTGDAIADATTMNDAIAETIRLQPAQFTWKLRIFKTCPNDNGPRYSQVRRGIISIDDL